MPPTFVELKSLASIDGVTIITFLGADGQQYSCSIADTLMPELAHLIQEDLLRLGQGRPALTLTVVQSESILTPEAKGLAFQTLEAGTIAIRLPDEAIQILKQQLAALESVPAAKTSH